MLEVVLLVGEFIGKGGLEFECIEMVSCFFWLLWLDGMFFIVVLGLLLFYG